MGSLEYEYKQLQKDYEALEKKYQERSRVPPPPTEKQAGLAAISRAVREADFGLEDIFEAIAWRFDIRYVPEIGIVTGKYKATVLDGDGIDALTLIALTDLKEARYGITIDKKKYRIALEDETEDSVYLKIVKKQPLTTGEK